MLRHIAKFALTHGPGPVAPTPEVIRLPVQTWDIVSANSSPRDDTVPIEFFVPGIARPGGSKKGFRNQYTGRIQMVDASKHVKGWRQTVANAAAMAMAGEPFTGPLSVQMTFVAIRPKGHYGIGKNAASLKPSAPAVPTTRPDVLKLARAVEDALTGILWRDDSQITHEVIEKQYGGRPGVHIRVDEVTA